LYSALSATEPLGLMPTDVDADALAKFLRWCHSRSFCRKYQSGLFSAAVFDPDKPSPETRRGRDNIDHMGQLFVMDFENGMRAEEFADCLRCREMFATSRWSRLVSQRPESAAVQEAGSGSIGICYDLLVAGLLAVAGLF
jgi:hypothetical protein